MLILKKETRRGRQKKADCELTCKKSAAGNSRKLIETVSALLVEENNLLEQRLKFQMEEAEERTQAEIRFLKDHYKEVRKRGTREPS